MEPNDGLTKFERVWMLKTRAAQLNDSELPMTAIPRNAYDPLEIAEREHEDRKLVDDDSRSAKTSPTYRKKPPPA